MNTKAIDISALDAQAGAWTEAVGGFFRAFALIELLTLECVARMADPFKYKSMKKRFLAQRLTWIAENLHERAAEGSEGVDDLIALLDAIREESYFRNVLAHGAAGLTFPTPGVSDAEPGVSDAEPGNRSTPTLTGVLNFKPEDDSQDAELISLEEIRGRRDEAAALGAKLLDALNQLEFAPVA